NFFTIRDVLKHYAPEVLRYFIIASHYRSPLNYSSEALDNARASLERFYAALTGLDPAEVTEPDDAAVYEARFVAAMDDDFNTPEALAVLFEVTREINRLVKSESLALASRYGVLLRRLGGVLGLLQQDANTFRQAGVGDADFVARVERVVAAIAEARKAKDFATSDRLRDELKAKGVVVEFSRDGIKWRKAD
ncbi:MAG: cysteine--tRNA ligase, partial [Moraxellaceae bacterium]|nr:cysteine--tRNA ligase [Moraxellaceae bacterium]